MFRPGAPIHVATDVRNARPYGRWSHVAESTGYAAACPNSRSTQRSRSQGSSQSSWNPPDWCGDAAQTHIRWREPIANNDCSSVRPSWTACIARRRDRGVDLEAFRDRCVALLGWYRRLLLHKLRRRSPRTALDHWSCSFRLCDTRVPDACAGLSNRRHRPLENTQSYPLTCGVWRSLW